MGLKNDSPTILAELSPLLVQSRAHEYLRNMVRSDKDGMVYHENGDLRTPLALVYEASWGELNTLLQKSGRTVESDPILRELAKMDGMPGLSKEELAAGLLAAEALPTAGHAFKTTLLVNTVGQPIDSRSRESDFTMGMGANIDERHLQLAVGHMKEYMATARQFLGDNYEINVVDEAGQPMHTRNSVADAEYTKLMRESEKALNKDFKASTKQRGH